MTDSASTAAVPPSPSPAPDAVKPHADPHPVDDHAFVYPTSGIAEGHARVPKWLAAVIFGLLLFFGWYIATQWDAQPTTAQNRK